MMTLQTTLKTVFGVPEPWTFQFYVSIGGTFFPLPIVAPHQVYTMQYHFNSGVIRCTGALG